MMISHGNILCDKESKIIIQPIILCGGSGTRLWPISTPKNPKQLISLGEKGTLLEETIKRVLLVAKKCGETYKVNDPLLVMHIDHKLPSELNMFRNNIVYEDFANDTAVAVAKACIEIKNKDNSNDIIILSLPADHYIENVDIFITDIVDGINNINNENIVLYGIEPTSPETKYGYIIPSDNGVWFKEKPSMKMAEDLIKQKALWNSGIFAANINLILKYLYNSPYDIINWIKNPREGKAPSFDIAVLQEHKNIYAHHCMNWKWSDVGTWDSFISIPEIKNELNKNAIISQSCNVNILNRGLGNIVTIGCKNLMIIANGNDILIMSNDNDYNNNLKEIATRIYQ